MSQSLSNSSIQQTILQKLETFLEVRSYQEQDTLIKTEDETFAYII